MGIYKFFDKLEDHVRRFLSHYPLWYAAFGGTGVVIFWRGIWHSMDYVVFVAHHSNFFMHSESLPADLIWWDGPLSILIGTCILLVTGLFVSDFIGNEVIISGLKKEKKISEKSEKEIKDEDALLHHLDKELQVITKKIVKPKSKSKVHSTRS